MSDYTKIVDYAAKDALLTGNPAKLVKGTEIGAEFDAIVTAVATKVDETGGAATNLTLTTPILGTPQSGTVTNLTGTASININGTVGATTPAAGAFTTLSATIGITGPINEARGSIAMHATTMDLWAQPNIIDGTSSAVTITAIANAPQAGARRVLYPVANSIITNGATFAVDGAANATAAAGDAWEFEAVTISTYKVHVIKNDGTSVSGIATQADQEAASSLLKTVSPGRQQYHPSAAKAWVHFDAAGNLTASYNMTSVTDSGTGNFSPVWATDFSSTAYCVVATSKVDVSGITTNLIATVSTTNFGAGGCNVTFVDINVVLRDPTHGEVIAFGDQ